MVPRVTLFAKVVKDSDEIQVAKCKARNPPAITAEITAVRVGLLLARLPQRGSNKRLATNILPAAVRIPNHGEESPAAWIASLEKIELNETASTPTARIGNSREIWDMKGVYFLELICRIFLLEGDGQFCSWAAV